MRVEREYTLATQKLFVGQSALVLLALSSSFGLPVRFMRDPTIGLRNLCRMSSFDLPIPIHDVRQ